MMKVVCDGCDGVDGCDAVDGCDGCGYVQSCSVYMCTYVVHNMWRLPLP